MTTEIEELRQLRAELTAIRADNAAHAAATTAAAAAAPLLADQVSRTGLSREQLAVASLVRHSNWDYNAACEEVLSKGAAAFEQEIAWEAHVVNTRLASENDAAFALTPAGKLREAAALRAEDEELEREVEAAERLLLDQGFSEDDLTNLTWGEVLEGAGVHQPDAGAAPADSLAANLAYANAMNANSEGAST